MNWKFILFILIFIFCNSLFFAQNSKNKLYKTNVTASYYAEAFHGKLTSSGEKFNMNDFTCAHKELPFDTVLKVTNLKNGLSVNVRVNDRGPFVLGREIDLSCAAAKQLKMIGDGTAKVKLEIVKLTEHSKQSKITAEKAMEKMAKIEGKPENQTQNQAQIKTQNRAQSKTQNRESGKIWDIQLGAFSSQENANKLAQSLLKAGFKDVVFQKSGGIIRVAIRCVPTEELASMEKRLKEKSFKEYTIKERKIQSQKNQ